MRNSFLGVLTTMAVGCTALPSCTGVEPSKPTASTHASTASLGVIYYAPAWGQNTNGEEVVYFLKQVMLRSRTEEKDRIYLCSIKPDGTERREIAQMWKDQPDQYLGTYAADVTLDVNVTTKRAAIGLETGGRGGIFVVNLDGTGLHSVWPKEWKEDRPKKAGYPTWSPDGQWLAFQEFRDEPGLFAYRVVKCRPDGTGYLPLTDRKEYNYQPAWSPKGDLIAYVEHKQLHLWLMKPDGSEKRDLKHWGRKPRWSVDGKAILLENTWLVDATSGVKMRNLMFPGIYPKWGKEGAVSVTPDGISVALGETEKVIVVLKNALRRGEVSDSSKEAYRW